MVRQFAWSGRWFLGSLRRFVDPDLGLDSWWSWSASEAFGVLAPGPLEGSCALLVDVVVGVEVHGCRCVPADPGVAVDVVVLGEEAFAELLGLRE